ncbi:sensor histidine kinase [Angustibacter luteus]|uniref:histidine kinase n=1 Tax=Angustibacter luteus TaxID=658456 RepID=A0ABW1JBH3_9ACTN
MAEAGLAARLDRVSLRDRLVAVLVLLALVALTIMGTLAVTLLRGQLVSKVDDQILATEQVLVRNPDSGPQQQQQQQSPRGIPTSTFGVFLPDTGGNYPIGRRIGSGSPDLDAITDQVVAQHDGKPFTVQSATGGGHWRVVAVQGTDAELGPGTLVIGQSLRDVDDTVTRMAVILLVVGVIVLVLVGVAGALIVRQTLRPLREVEDVAGAIAAGDLSRRVPEHPTSTEVGRLAASLNAMLSQIERAFAVQSASEERMRRFASDASHELRTPLAAVRGYAELYRQGAVTQKADLDTTMRRIENEATRMGGLVEDLLTLARLDEQRDEKRVPVDLTVVAADAVQDARALDPARSVRLTGRGGEPLGPIEVLGDEPRLRQVVTNLVANALRHTPAGSPVELAVGHDGAFGIVEVRDHGTGIAPDHARKVFERFFRADASRQRSSGGSGLGLAIVAAIVGAHGGQVGVSETPGGGATFAVRLPLVRNGLAFTGHSQEEPSAQPTA